MKTTYSLFAFMLLGLTACSTMHPEQRNSDKADPETVLVIYHVKPGKEAELQTVLSRAWEIYRREHLVFAEPHILVRNIEDEGKTRFVEVFTWVSHSAPDRAPDSVKTMWEQEQSLCETRNGHTGIEGGEVDLLIPSHK